MKAYELVLKAKAVVENPDAEKGDNPFIKKGEKTGTGGTKKTGDNMNINHLLLMMALSGGILASYMGKKLKLNKKR